MSAERRPTRWIALDGAVNARAVVPGVLLRSDNLQSLSARDVRVLVADQRLELVLDLRTAAEVSLEGPSTIGEQPGVRIEHHSLYPESRGNTDLEAGSVKPWKLGYEEDHLTQESLVLRAYMGYLRHRPDSIVGAVRAIARAEGAVLVHCAAGKDRTGVVVAIALDAAGVERDAIVADYVATGERIDAIIARLLSSSTYRAELEGHSPQRHAPVPATMECLLELVDERLGGSAAWLCANGLAAADLERLHRRLTLARALTRD